MVVEARHLAARNCRDAIRRNGVPSPKGLGDTKAAEMPPRHGNDRQGRGMSTKDYAQRERLRVVYVKGYPLGEDPSVVPTPNFQSIPSVSSEVESTQCDCRLAICSHSASSRDYMPLLLEGHRDGCSISSSTGSITLKGKGVPNLRRKPCTALSSA